MKTLKITAILLLSSVICFAQDSTLVSPIAVADLPNWLKVGLPIAYGIYEVVVRYIPTVKNYSPLGWLIKLIQTILPNNNSNGPKHS